METVVFDFIHYVLNKNIVFAYLFFFLSAILQMLFPPFPSDVILVFEGYVTTVSKSFGFIPVLLNAMIGTFIGSITLYEFGAKKGNSVFKYKFIAKYIDEKHRRRTEKVFEKYGSFAIIVSKFVPGINAIMLLFSGIFKMKARIVYPSIFASILIHHILFLLLGRFLGHNLPYVGKILKAYNSIAITIFLFMLICGVVFYFVRKKYCKAKHSQ